MSRKIIGLLLVCAMVVSLTGCGGITVVKKGDEAETVEQNDIAGIWDSSVMKEIRDTSVELTDLLTEADGDLKRTGEKYGHYSNGSSGSLNYAIHASGQISEVNVEKKAGDVVVRPDGYEGEVKVMLQIGTVYKGTAIRDYLSFINVNDYGDQIAYAQLAKDFNAYVAENVADYEQLSAAEGKNIEFYGCFNYDNDSELLVTPVEVTIS